MLRKISLTNFRGFDEHSINLQPTTVIVGQNNAGKSSIVEALRLISLVVSDCKSRGYIPRRWKLSRSARAVKRLAPSLQTYEIETSERVFYRYQQPPAVIRGWFTSGADVTISIWGDEITAIISSRNINDLSFVSNLPQVAPLALEEKLLNPETVRGAMSSKLAPLHFRNQVHLLRDQFQDFTTIVEASWFHLRVMRPEVIQHSLADNRLTMMVTDGDFTAEIAWMGDGLQMWLQTMWFLTRVRSHETVILDEPDVYMHADLQRKLIRLLKGRHPQVIIATHSAEIMAEVEPEEILIITRDQPTSSFAASLPTAQQLLSNLGSVHNLQLARLATAKRFVFVEGDDIAVLKRFQDTLFPESDFPLDTLSMQIHGWGGWNYAIGSSQLLQQTAEGTVCYCLFDSDYHTAEEITERLEDAKKRHIQLRIWNRKELENYLMVPSAIRRVILARSPKKLTKDAIADKIDAIVESLREHTIDAIGSELQKRDRKKDYATVAKEAKSRLQKAWKTRESRWGIVSGKEVLSQLSAWAKKSFNVSFSMLNIAKEMLPGELAKEVAEVLTAVEKGDRL